MGLIVRLAPLGVLGAVAYTVGKYGVGSLKQLVSLVALFYVSVAIFVLGVLGGVMALAGLNIFKFLGYLREELTIVLATASSDAVLPQIMRKLERMGVKDSVVGLVIPTGYSFNLDAFSIYLTLAVVFIAQATNTPLSFGDLLLVLGVSLVTSKGAHGVPGSAIVILAATLNAVPSIPAIGLVLVLSVDWFIGMARALGNLIGNCVATVVVAAWEGDLDRAKARRVLDGDEAGGRDGGVTVRVIARRRVGKVSGRATRERRRAHHSIPRPENKMVGTAQSAPLPTLRSCIARCKILDQPQQHARAGVGIGELDMLVGMMADAAAAAHEHHRDIGDVDHRHAVMPRPARQFEHAKTFCRDGFGDLRLQPGRAGHGAVFVGDVDLQRQLAALGDRFDPPDDIGHRELAVRVGRGADVDGEGHLSRDHIGRAGHRVDVADGADQPALDRFGRTPRSRRCIRRRPPAHRAAAPSAPFRHGRPCRSGSPRAGWRPISQSPRRPAGCSLPAPAPARCAVRHRQATRGAHAPPRRCDRDRGRISMSASRIEIPARSLAPSTLSSKVPATARLPSSVDAKRTPSSSANPVTSMANGSRRPRLFRSATQAIAVIRPSGPSHLPASRTVS